MARAGWPVGDDRGAVTVEAALALCSLMVVLALAIGAVAAVGAQLRCLDAARETARLVARGEPVRARSVGESIAPSGARIQVGIVGDAVTVEVSSRIAGRLPGLTVSATAVGVLEPGTLAAGEPGTEPNQGTHPEPETAGDPLDIPRGSGPEAGPSTEAGRPPPSPIDRQGSPAGGR